MPREWKTKDCAICGRPFRFEVGGRGRLPDACGPECQEVQASFARLRWALQKVQLPASAAMALRKELWLTGNAMRVEGGRKPGTAYWALTLACGHQVEGKRRSRQVGGASVPDPAPRATRCATCHKRVEVVGAEVATEPTPN